MQIVFGMDPAILKSPNWLTVLSAVNDTSLVAFDTMAASAIKENILRIITNFQVLQEGDANQRAVVVIQEHLTTLHQVVVAQGLTGATFFSSLGTASQSQAFIHSNLGSFDSSSSAGASSSTPLLLWPGSFLRVWRAGFQAGSQFQFQALYYDISLPPVRSPGGQRQSVPARFDEIFPLAGKP